MTWSTGFTTPGATAHRFGVAVVDLDAVLAQHRDGHVDVGERGHRLAVVAYVDPVVVARPGQQQRRDELRGGRRVDDHRGRRAPTPSRAPRTAAHRGRRRRRRRRARAARPAPHRPVGSACAGRRRSRPSPVDRPAAGGTNRITVPASPQSTCGVAGRTGPGVTVQSSAAVSTAEPSPVSAAAISSGVAGPERAAYDARTVGQRGQQQRPVGQRLAAGQRDHGVDRTPRPRGGPGPAPSPTNGTLSSPAPWPASPRGGPWRRSAWPRGGRP